MEQFSGQDIQTMWNMGGLQSPPWPVTDGPCLYGGWQQELPNFLKNMPLSPVDYLPTDAITYNDSLGDALSSSLCPSPGSEKSEESALVSQTEKTNTDSHTWMGTDAQLCSMMPEVLAMIQAHGPAIFADGGRQPYRITTTTQEDDYDASSQEVQKPTISLSTKESAITTSNRPRRPRRTHRITSTLTTAAPTAPMAAPGRKRKSRVSSHNETERKYRGRINQQFQLLAEVLCINKQQSSSDDEAKGPSKAEVLSAATQYIRSLQKDVDSQARHVNTLQRALQSLPATTASSALTVDPWESIL